MSAIISENQEFIDQFRNALDADVSKLLTDRDCLRFLRARKYDVAKAALMATNWATWWKTPFGENELANITPSNILSEHEFDPNESIYEVFCPHTMFGFTKEGHPVYWEKTGTISNALKQLKTKTTIVNLVARHVRLQEMLRARLHYSNTKLGILNTDQELEKCVVIFDLKDLAYTPDMFGINYVRDMFTCDGHYYPERLHKMVMINAPWYFTAIWALVSFVVDPVTAQKISILGSDYDKVLKDLIQEDNIPAEFGGTAVVQWKYPYPEGSGCSPSELKQYLASKSTVETVKEVEEEKGEKLEEKQDVEVTNEVKMEEQSETA